MGRALCEEPAPSEAEGARIGPPTTRDLGRTLYSYARGLLFHSHLRPANLLINPSQNRYLLVRAEERIIKPIRGSTADPEEAWCSTSV